MVKIKKHNTGCAEGNACGSCDDCSKCLDRLQWDFKLKDPVEDPRKIQLDIHCGTKFVDITAAVQDFNLYELKDVDDCVRCAKKCDMLRFNGEKWVAQKPEETESLYTLAGFTEGGCLVRLPHPEGLPTKYLSTNPDGSVSLKEIGAAGSEVDLSKALVLDEDGNIVYVDLQTVLNDLGTRLTNIENAIYNWDDDKTTKIPRGNINLFSGAMGGPNYIRSRDGVQNNDLRQA